MFGKLLGSTAAGIVKPLADAASDVAVSRERTRQVYALAMAQAKVASATWRPALAKATGGALVLYVAGTTLFALINLYGVVRERSWVMPYDDGTSPLIDFWGRWTTLGAELFGFAALFLTTYAASRGIEKASQSLSGRGVLANAGRVLRREPRREPLQGPEQPIERLDGIVVPQRDRAPESAPQPARAVGEPVAWQDWQWSARSEQRLSHAHSDLQALFDWLLPRSPYDLMIGETIRTVAKQRQYVQAGTSKIMDSRHLERPAMAVDFYVIDPQTGKASMGATQRELDLYVEVLTLLREGSVSLGIPVTSGGLDWGWDYFHVELDRSHYPRQRSVLDEPDVPLA